MKLFPLLAGGLALAIALPALAAGASVSYSDLDLSKPADVATLKARLDAAAKTACAGNNKVQLDGNRRVTCRTQVHDRVVASLPESARAALTGAKTPATEWAAR